MSSLAELTDAYLAGAEQLRSVVAGMTPEQVAARPVPGKWSTLEVVAHLADFEPVFADRMRRVVALDRPLLLAADENDFAKHLVYEKRDVGEELAVVDATRKQMARILRNLPEAALERVGIHSLKGIVTLEQVVRVATNHVAHHLTFIREKKRALGIG